jgi:hypothetical protein
MNPATPAIPSLRSLYRCDLTIRRAANAIIAGVVAPAGILWATRPATSPPPGVDLSFELAAANWAPLAGAFVVVLGGIFLARRYLWVKKVFSQGITIKGIVKDLEVHSWTPSRDSTTSAVRRPQRHAYWATVRYAVHGVEREACLRLPNSGFTYGLAKDRETDLMVLDWVPDKPLIRSVYLGKS